MSVISSLRSKKAAPPMAQVGLQPEANVIRRTSARVSASSTAAQASSLSASSRSKLSPLASAPKPASDPSPPLTRGVSPLRKAPRSKLSQVTGSAIKPGDDSRTSTRSAPTAAAPVAARSGIPTSTASLSRPGSVASAASSRPSSSAATRRISPSSSPPTKRAVKTEASSPSSCSAARASPPRPDLEDAHEDEDLATSTPTPFARSTSLSPSVIGPISSSASAQLRRSMGSEPSSTGAAVVAQCPPQRIALAETKTNGTVIVVQKSRKISDSPSKVEPPTKAALPVHQRASTEGHKTAPLRPSPTLPAPKGHRKSQAAPSPPVVRQSSATIPITGFRPRPRPISMIQPSSGPGSVPKTASPSTGALKLRPSSAIPVSPKLKTRTASGQATPTRLGLEASPAVAGRSLTRGIEVVVTPSRADEGNLGLPSRSSLSYPSPQPLDTLSPPMVREPLPKSPLNRLSNAGRLVPRSSLVSFEAMSRTLLPPEDSLLIEEADTSEFGVALSGVVSPPSSYTLRSSRKRREITASSDGSDATRDPFGSLSTSSSNHSFIPLPIASSPQAPEVSHAALHSRLQQSLLAQAALQRELEAERARSKEAELADDSHLDRTADITLELNAFKVHVGALESREEETREETAALEELLQASQDDLAAAEARVRGLQGTVESLASSSDVLRQQASELAEALEGFEARAGEMLQGGQRTMVDEWEAVARRAREELAACRGEREMLALVEGMARWEIQAA